MTARLVRAARHVCLVGVVVFVVLGSSAGAARVAGTARADRLVGTPRADRLDGRGGNDTLLGLGGNDVLVGGAGNDRLAGGPGADVLDCGAGRDLATADVRDTVSPSCETVKGIPKPALTISDASVSEGNSGLTTLTFAVTSSAPSPLTVSVRFATSDDTATSPSDYAAASGVLTFEPRERHQDVRIAVVGDTAFEQDETMTVALTSPVNATIADGSATGTITNDDPRPARPGYYSGKIQSQDFPDFEFINFAVREDGQSVGPFGFVFFADCQPEGTFEFAPVTGSGPVVIGSDKRFSVDGKGEGTTEIKVSGTFDAAGTSASGSFQAHVGFTDQGSHYECDTGQRPWSATWKAPLGPTLTTTIGDTGNLVMSFDEGELQKYPSVSYRLDAVVTASWACAGGQTMDTRANATNTVTGVVPDSRGHARGTIVLAAPTPPSSCSQPTLERVEYGNVKLTNLTTDRSVFTGPFSRTFS
jgi:hypothetical protein